MESVDTEEFVSRVSQDSESAEEIAINRERLRRLTGEMTGILTPAEMRLVEMIVTSKGSLSGREYADKLGVTESRISQTISSIIKKIKRWDTKQES
jgi:DNA-binding CsgD family transcriptional regulator